MKKIAWISHYPSETDIFRINNFKWKNEAIRKWFININKHYPPYIFTDFVNYDKEIEYFGIICPILPHVLVSLDKERQLSIIKKALYIANRLKANQIGIASLFASMWEDPKELLAFTKIPITTGKNFIGSLVFEYIARACNLIEKDIKNCTLGIIGYKTSLSKIFLQHYKDKVQVMLLDEEDAESKKYDMIKKSSLENIFQHSDILITNTIGLGLEKYIANMKPGCIICDLMVPFYLTREINKSRKDILAFEGVWAKYKELNNYKDKKGQIKNLLPHEIVPACIAEPLMLTLENIPSYFSTVGNITYKNALSVDKMRFKHKFDFFGFKQGNFIYMGRDLERIKNAVRR